MSKRRRKHERTMSNYEIAELNGYRELTAEERFKAIARETSQLLDFLANTSIREFELHREQLKFERLSDDEVAFTRHEN